MTTKIRNLIIIALVVIASVGLILATKPAPETPGGYRAAQIFSALATEETLFDFGTVSMGRGNVGHDFKVRNESGEPVEIEKIYTSCMCTAAYFVKDGKKLGPFGMLGHGFVPSLRKKIEPGEEIVIAVVFDPAAHGPAGVGPVEREIYLEGKSGVLAAFQIKALVTP